MRLIVTRPQPQADAWVARLKEAGFDAAALPLLRTEPSDEPAAPTAQAAFAAADGIVFVSPAAVAHGFAAAGGALSPWPAPRWAAAPGPGTAERLVAAGVPPACIVEPDPDAGQFDSEALWQRLHARVAAGSRVVIVRGDGGRDWLADTMRAAGADVRFVAAYRRAAPRPSAAEQALLAAALAEPARHLWLFSSSEAIDHLAALAPRGADWSSSQALATHPRIEARARALGCGRVWSAPPAFDAVAARLRALATTP